MKLKLITLIPIILATGCASPPIWNHMDGLGNRELQYDHMRCDSYSRGSTPMPSNNPTSYEARGSCVGAYCNVTVQESNVSANSRNLAGIMAIIIRQNKYKSCMYNMGWYEAE